MDFIYKHLSKILNPYIGLVAVFFLSGCSLLNQETQIVKPSPQPTEVKKTTPPPINKKLVVKKKEGKKLYALVIGNSSYHGNRLKNTRNDADAMTRLFTQLGFNVLERKDLTEKQFKDSIIDFSLFAKDADVTLMFYAGHAIQYGGVNYLIPIDIDFESDPKDALLGSIDLDKILLRNIPGKDRVVFLDACRNNPFKKKYGNEGFRKISETNLSAGTLVSYAAREGGVSFDGVPGGNSPYTQGLLKFLTEKKDIALVLRDVRSYVEKVTRNQQIPWEYSALEEQQFIISTLAQ